jgi:hypothetical protein
MRLSTWNLPSVNVIPTILEGHLDYRVFRGKHIDFTCFVSKMLIFKALAFHFRHFSV